MDPVLHRGTEDGTGRPDACPRRGMENGTGRPGAARIAAWKTAWIGRTPARAARE